MQYVTEARIWAQGLKWNQQKCQSRVQHQRDYNRCPRYKSVNEPGKQDTINRPPPIEIA